MMCLLILGSLFVHSQYDDRPLKTASGDDGKERMVPVHPMLRAILAQWKLTGWAQLFGRPPTDADFIVLDARNLGALCKSLTGSSGRTRTVAGTSWFGRFSSDCAERYRSEDLAETQ